MASVDAGIDGDPERRFRGVQVFVDTDGLDKVLFPDGREVPIDPERLLTPQLAEISMQLRAVSNGRAEA